MSSIKGFLPLTSSKEFNFVYKTSKTFHTKYFVIFYLNDNKKRFSVVASKKIGNAVKRNFAKRRLRALFIEQDIKIGTFVLVAKKDIIDVDYKVLKKQFQKGLISLKNKKNTK